MRDGRIGIAWHLVRAHAAMLLDWYRVVAKHGWFASARKAKRSGVRHTLAVRAARSSAPNATAARPAPARPA